MSRTALHGAGGEKPSRLLQMRDDYQRCLLKEKEEKMLNMYEDHQRRNQERAERVTRGGTNGSINNNNSYPNSKLPQPCHIAHLHQHPSPEQMSSSPSVRAFFRERRELEAKGRYVLPIDQHYKLSKSRTSSSNSFHKNSAGVDRSQPLAPIPHHNNGRGPLTQQNPFNNKPRLVRHHNTTRNPTNTPENDENDNYKADHYDNNNKHKPSPTQSRNSPGRRPAPQTRRANPSPGRGSVQRSQDPSATTEKMSDFQKWQMEQAKAREERLKKTNTKQPPPQQSGSWGKGDEDGGGGGSGGDKQTKQQERELLEKIAKQQAELERLQREREEEQEMERRRATEMSKKREAAERRRQQEEARRRRQEEEEERRRASQRDDTNDLHTQRNTNRRNVQPTPRQAQQDSTPRNPQPRQQRRLPPPQRRPRTPEEEADDEDDSIPVPGPGSEIYAQATDGEQGGRVKLVPCKVCGRKFAEDRVQKHQGACKKSHKKRKVFDPTQMRTEGTEMAKYITKGAHKQEPPKKKNKADWRRQHEEFIANIRYAKQMQQMEQKGVPIKDLPPPPPSHNPDLVPCPHCGRTFNEVAAERHIPRCQQLNTRPAGQ